FAGLEHLADDVAAADELALDVKLRDRRPVRKFLDPLAHRRVGEDVDAFELDAEMAEDLDHGRRKAALRENRRALHEEYDRCLADLLADAILQGGFHRFDPRFEWRRSGGWSASFVWFPLNPWVRWSAAQARAAHCPSGRAMPDRPAGA